MTTPTMRKATTLQIYADSRHVGRCRSCGANIEWATLTASGKQMPFDLPLQPVESQPALLGEGRVIETINTRISKPHFATCPSAAQHRKR